VLLSAMQGPDWALASPSKDRAYPEQLSDKTLSRSLLAGLLVLSCLPLDGSYIGVADVARRLGMNTSTTHRYMKTLWAVGLVEREAESRKYRIAGIG
jgi:DNA-binding MarR family transcriptional regulator